MMKLALAIPPVLAALAALPAIGAVEVTRSTSNIQTASSVEILGNQDSRELESAFMVLHGMGPVTENYALVTQTVVVPNGSATVVAQGRHTLTQAPTQFSFHYDGGTKFNAQWDTPIGTDISTSLWAAAGTSTEFTLTENAVIQFDAIMNFQRDAPREQNFSHARITLWDAQNSTILEFSDLNDSIEEQFLLTPGDYTLIITSISTLSSFTAGASGVASAFAFGNLDATVTVTTIPTPSAALLFTFAAIAHRRRR